MSRTPCRTFPDGRFSQSAGPTAFLPRRLEAGGPAMGRKLEFLNPSGSSQDCYCSTELKAPAGATAVLLRMLA
jgi:hypothetical protein